MICTRNRRSWLQEAVASVQAQKGAPWELVIVDDGSTDDTWEYCQTLVSVQCRCLRRTNSKGNRAEASGLALTEARGEFAMFLDDDDVLADQALATLAEGLRAHPDAVAAVGARWDWFCDGRGGGRRDSHVWFPSKRDIYLELLFGWSAVSGQNLYRTAKLREAGEYRSGFWPCDDRDLWLRMEQVITNEAEATRLGEALQARLACRCDSQLAAPRLAAIYRELAAGQRN